MRTTTTPAMKRRSTFPVLLLVLAVFTPLQAYPPAPAFTAYGTVRDAYGWELVAESAEVVFRDTATNRIIANGPVSPGSALMENYRVLLPLDHARAGSPYRAEAVTLMRLAEALGK